MSQPMTAAAKPASAGTDRLIARANQIRERELRRLLERCVERAANWLAGTSGDRKPRTSGSRRILP